MSVKTGVCSPCKDKVDDRVNAKSINALFRKYYKGYCEKYKGHILPEQYRVMNALLTCRTADLGGHLYKCDSCEKHHIVYNSCKNRHCPTCQGLKSAEWLLKRSTEILPIQYFHIVFTVPDELNPLFLQNKKELYTLFFKSVSKTLKQLSRDQKYLGAGQIGFISVLHTWGQTLLDHPHIHTIVTGGGLSKDKTRWIRCKKDFFIHVKVMSQRFRCVFLSGLKELYKKHRLEFHGKIKAYKWKSVFQKLIDRMFSKSWVVNSEANYSEAKNIFDYLGRYVRKVAIDNHRIIKVEQDRVYFSYKDYADKNKKKKVMDLDVYEFMRRFLLHVLPKRFVKIRYYGLLGHKDRKKKLLLCRKLLHVKEGSGEIEIPETWKELFEYVTGHEVSRCPYCKKGTLVYVQEILPQIHSRGP